MKLSNEAQRLVMPRITYMKIYFPPSIQSGGTAAGLRFIFAVQIDLQNS